jgi:RHS repeat-associated protein
VLHLDVRRASRIGAGQRIKKVTQTETRIFHYDLLGHIIAETNQSGQMIAEYIYLGDQLLAMIKPGELAYYFHNDHLGTPQVLTDGNGSIAWRAVYTPFGEAVISVATVENPFRFPGQYYDQETGLHYNYFRYYDPITGRYITPDPIGLEGGINLFAYVAGNPIRHTDPKGLAVPVAIAIGACLANPACARAVLAGGAATALALSKLIETIGVPSEPMPTPDLSNIPERCRIEYEICKKAADQAECGEVKRTAKKAWCWTKFLICLVGTGL